MGHRPGGRSGVRADVPFFFLLRRAGSGARKVGTPVASYVARLPPDARPLDRGKPRDEDTEGGTQPADKSLINRRLQLRPQPCAALLAYSAPASIPTPCRQTVAAALDRGHKRLIGRGKCSFGLASPDPSKHRE